MDRRSRFEYGVTSFECEVSAKPWTPGYNTIGGSRKAASGLPASYIVDEEHLVDLFLRIRESEWTAYRALIAYGKASGEITWYPDADEPTSYLCYLESPSAGERVTPSRDGNYPRIFEVQLTLRGVDSEIPWQPYFD